MTPAARDFVGECAALSHHSRGRSRFVGRHASGELLFCADPALARRLLPSFVEVTVSSKKPKRPRFVPQMILTSSTLAGLAVVPAVTLDCGGKAEGQPTQGQYGTVAAVFDAGHAQDASFFGVAATVSAAFDAGTFSVAANFDASVQGVAATFDAGFGVGAAFDAGGFTVAAMLDSGTDPDAFGFTVAALQDSGDEPDAFGFTVAANNRGGDEPGKG
jgi:hypothetical protein